MSVASLADCFNDLILRFYNVQVYTVQNLLWNSHSLSTSDTDANADKQAPSHF